MQSSSTSPLIITYPHNQTHWENDQTTNAMFIVSFLTRMIKWSRNIIVINKSLPLSLWYDVYIAAHHLQTNAGSYFFLFNNYY